MGRTGIEWRVLTKEPQGQACIDEIRSTVTTIDHKVDQLVINQQRLLVIFHEMAKLMTKLSEVAQTPVDEEKQDLLQCALCRKYGVTCTATVAARILGVSSRTIARMIEDGRLTKVGIRVDVRSIDRYLNSPKPMKSKDEHIDFREASMPPRSKKGSGAGKDKTRKGSNQQRRQTPKSSGRK